jgi:DUF4097 and DUF4098 domain-containing protein YvlB
MLVSSTLAAEDVDQTLQAESDGNVNISNTSGMVTVIGWSRNEVSVSGEIGSGVDELVFERSGDDVDVIVKVRRDHGRSISSDLVVRVPEDSSVKVGTVSADIEVSDLQGAQALHSVSGDIDSEAYASDVEIESVSGDIELQGDGKTAAIELSTVSGDVDAQDIAGNADFGSVSGDITVIESVFERVRMNTTNGDIVFRARLLEGGRLSAETINGEVDIEFDGPVSARFDIETFNGDIDNCFGPDPVRTSKYTPGLELKFSEGGGNGRVDINTLNGEISLCRE